MKKIILFLLLLVSNCFPQLVPKFQHQPPFGHQVNLAHPGIQDLVGFWIFNEGSGATVFNSLNDNNGTLTNMVTVDAWVSGRDGYAIHFDGSDQYIVEDNSGTLDFKSATNNKITVIISIRTTTTSASWLFNNFEGPEFDLGMWTSSGVIRVAVDGITELSTTTTINDGLWHNVGFSHIASSDLIIYIDGINNASSTVGASTWFTNFALYFGGSPTDAGGVGDFVGDIGYVFVWDRILTEAEVLSHHIYSYSMFEQPPGRILAVAAAAAAVERRRLIIAND